MINIPNEVLEKVKGSFPWSPEFFDHITEDALDIFNEDLKGEEVNPRDDEFIKSLRKSYILAAHHSGYSINQRIGDDLSDYLAEAKSKWRRDYFLKVLKQTTKIIRVLRGGVFEFYLSSEHPFEYRRKEYLTILHIFDKALVSSGAEDYNLQTRFKNGNVQKYSLISGLAGLQDLTRDERTAHLKAVNKNMPSDLRSSLKDKSISIEDRLGMYTNYVKNPYQK